VAGGDRESGSGAAAGVDDVVAVERRVRAHHHQPDRPGPAGASEGVGEQFRRAAHRVRRPLAQPGGGDQRRGQRHADRGQQCVESVDPGVAAPGALFGVAVGLAHRVVQIQERDLVGAGQDRGRGGEPGQQPGGHGVELADMPEGEQS
jgi:hypothetical protein